MKKYAIVVFLLPCLVICAFMLHTPKADHCSSPAFSVALDRAVNQLEGAAARVTAAVTPKLVAAPAD
ncbi:MAG: hypothetical protein JSV33_12020, partial [bacterium]